MANPKKHLKLLLEDKENGQIICGCGCGQVVESNIPDPGKQLHDSDVGFGGTAITLTKHDNNLTTKIDKIPGKSDFNRLAKVQNWVTIANPREARLSGLLQSILYIGEKLNLGKSIINEACYHARKIQRGNRKIGFTRQSLACVLLFLASKRSFTPKSIGAFLQFYPKKARTSFLVNALNLKEELKINYDIRSKVPQPIKPKKIKTPTEWKKPTMCFYCSEQTTRKNIILEDGTKNICCSFCEQYLRTQHVKFHREGTVYEEDLTQWRKRGLSLNDTEWLEFKDHKKRYMLKSNITKFSDSQFLAIVMKAYVESIK